MPLALTPMLVEPARGAATTMTIDEPRPERNLSVAQSDAQSPCIKLQHVEVLVKMTSMGLSE